MDLKNRLDQQKNPFFKHAEAQYFLAWRDGRAVGRISAHVDRNFNEFQGNEWGLFGWFECEDDPEAAPRAARRRRGVAARARPRPDGGPDGLHDERRDWAAGRGARVPADHPLPLAPPLLPAPARAGRRHGQGDGPVHVEPVRGQTREASIPRSGRPPTSSESEHGIVCRSFRKKDLHAEVTRFLEVYNAAWENNWASVPLNEEEVAPLRQRPEAGARRELGDDRRKTRTRARSWGSADAARLQPGAGEAQRAPAAASGWVTACARNARSTRCACSRWASSPSTSTPAWRRASTRCTSTPPNARPQKGGEMGWILEVNKPMNRAMEGDGRRDQAPLPGVRAGVRRPTRVAAPPVGDSCRVGLREAGAGARARRGPRRSLHFGA